MPRTRKQKGWGTIGGRQNNPRRSAKQVTRRQVHSEDPRVQAALEKAAQERERLERRMAQEAASPTLGRVSGATWSARQRELEREAELAANAPKPTVPRHVRLGLPAPEAQGNGVWSMGQARSMLRAGYHLHRVQKVTGWGEKCFDDMKVDADGYGLPIE